MTENFKVEVTKTLIMLWTFSSFCVKLSKLQFTIGHSLCYWIRILRPEAFVVCNNIKCTVLYFKVCILTCKLQLKSLDIASVNVMYRYEDVMEACWSLLNAYNHISIFLLWRRIRSHAQDKFMNNVWLVWSINNANSIKWANKLMSISCNTMESGTQPWVLSFK